MESMRLLETYLKQVRLPTCLRHYRTVGEDAAHANLGSDGCLWARAAQEVAQRERNRPAQLSRTARFPARKALAACDCSCLPQLHKPQVLQRARGDYIQQAEPVLMLGNPGLGKPHLATS